MEKYEALKIEIVVFEEEDVITSSPPTLPFQTSKP